MNKDKLHYVLIHLIGIFLCATIAFKFDIYQYETSKMLLILTSLLSTFLFFFSFYYDNINVIDLLWGLDSFYLILNYSLKNLDKLLTANDLVKYAFVYFAFASILLYGLKHIVYYMRAFHGLNKENEDFRYKEFRSESKNSVAFWISSYFLLHQIPLLILTLGYLPLFNAVDLVLDDKQTPNLTTAFILILASNAALFFEIIADEQLFLFRVMKKEKKIESSKVIYYGLWKLVRHPNYLGEVLIFGILFLLDYTLTGNINCIGFVLMSAIFIFYSIPKMEKLMESKYKENYENYKQLVRSKLIPYIY